MNESVNEPPVKKCVKVKKGDKIADVFELPITVVNNVLYQTIRQELDHTKKI